MNAEVNGSYVTVTLSRRNLRSLLHKLDRNEGEGVEAIRTLMRVTENDLILVVIAEEDADHYGERPPGDMGSDIESKIDREDALARFDAGE